MSLVFASPIVSEFEQLNASFQQTNADAHLLYQNLKLHFNSLKSRIFDFNGHKKGIDRIDFGAKFLVECNSVIAQKGNTQQAQKEVKLIKERCVKVLEEAISQLSQRLPDDQSVLRKFSNFTPSIILNPKIRPNFADLPYLKAASTDWDILEDQYRKLLFVNWSEECGGSVPKDTIEFWLQVFENSNFKELAVFVLTSLSTPVSNATVERVFSLVSAVKTKARNSMQIHLLDSILRIRSELLLSGKCCKDFVPTQRMIDNFKSDIVYNGETTEVSKDDEDVLLFL